MDAQADAPTTEPAQDPASALKPRRFSLVLNLVRRLIDYGKELATTLQQGAGSLSLAAHACNFGTVDIGLIVARITQGLLRARALEARLELIALRPVAKPKATPSPRKPRTAPAAAPQAAEPLVEQLPTPEQIAAKVRRQPIGAVIADICRDLGILPCHPLWHELSRAVMRFGGSLARLVSDILHRPYPPGWLDATPFARLWPPTPCPAPAGTGPP
jgi:hypothetical protein